MKFEGVLFFPVTPFGTDGGLDEERLARHIGDGVEAGAGGVFVAPAYQGIGVGLYSSAVFALAFHKALAEGDTALAGTLLDEFHAPLVALRDEVPGYAVALVKAGVRLRGLDVGGVRAPLVDPTPEHLDRLAHLLDHGLETVAA